MMILTLIRRNRQMRALLRLQTSQNAVIAERLQQQQIVAQSAIDKQNWLSRQLETEHCAYNSLKLKADALEEDIIKYRRAHRELTRTIDELRTANQKQVESNKALAEKFWQLQKQNQ